METDPDPVGETLRRRLERQLRRAHEVQQNNLLIRLHSETVRAQTDSLLVVVGAEQCLRQALR